MSRLLSTFNGLCATKHGYLMIPLVGIGALGFIILLIKIAEFFGLPQ